MEEKMEYLFRTKPSQFLLSMKKNGMILNENIGEFQNVIDNEKDNQYMSLIVNIFEPIKNYGINYTYYVMIFKDLSLQKIKNLYRFFLTKWNILKTTNKYDLKEIKLIYTMESIVNYEQSEELKLIVAKSFESFINNGDFYFLFFINTFHEYLSPVTK